MLQSKPSNQDEIIATIEEDKTIPKADILAIGVVAGNSLFHWVVDCKGRGKVPAMDLAPLTLASPRLGGWSTRELEAISIKYRNGLIAVPVLGHN